VIVGEQRCPRVGRSLRVQIAGPERNLVVAPVKQCPESNANRDPYQQGHGAPDQLDAPPIVAGQLADGAGLKFQRAHDQQKRNEQAERNLPAMLVGEAVQARPSRISSSVRPNCNATQMRAWERRWTKFFTLLTAAPRKT